MTTPTIESILAEAQLELYHLAEVELHRRLYPGVPYLLDLRSLDCVAGNWLHRQIERDLERRRRHSVPGMEACLRDSRASRAKSSQETGLTPKTALLGVS